MAFYDTARRTSYFIEFGAGRPIVLLHGISNSGRAWGPQIAPLVEAGDRARSCRAWRVGQADGAHRRRRARGRYRSTAHSSGYRACRSGWPPLVGMIALELALRDPERIGQLVVANSFDKTSTPVFHALAEGWATIFERPGGPVQRLEQSWPSLVCPAFQSTPEGLRTYQVWHGIAATADGASLAHVARGIGAFDVTERTASLAMPTLFMAGNLDGMSPPETSHRMAERAPQGRLRRNRRRRTHLQRRFSGSVFSPSAGISG